MNIWSHTVAAATGTGVGEVKYIIMQISLITTTTHAHIIMYVIMQLHTLGLGDIENSELQLLQQRHCDYCHDIALEYQFYYKKQSKHHCTCVSLEIAIALI